MYQEQENSVDNSRFILPHIELSSRRKANINAADCNGETPLHYAAKRNRLEQVKLLLKKGAVIDIKNRFGYTPLYHAVRSGHTSMVKLLLEKGADINISSNSGKTALHLSVSTKEQTEITKLLLGETESPSTSCSDASIENVQTINQFYHW